MENIRATLAEPYEISTMANIVGMSPRTFQRRFLALAGVPAMQWLTKERISQSCILLETTDMDVDSISWAVGFGTAEAMRYHFRQSLNLSPSEYRKRFSDANKITMIA